ncbi:hypothetical protein C2E23DRAFT_448655 [Lenzites betulinus]|nr:hypothetical protein C2E23DRAFT_448655 [Lenzites betulinus]
MPCCLRSLKFSAVRFSWAYRLPYARASVDEVWYQIAHTQRLNSNFAQAGVLWTWCVMIVRHRGIVGRRAPSEFPSDCSVQPLEVPGSERGRGHHREAVARGHLWFPN